MAEFKNLQAKTILELMKRAPAGNAVKLTDPENYKKVGYQEFFSEFPNLDVTKEQRIELENLQEEMGYLRTNQSYREDKLYVYFILKLQEILYEGGKE